MITAHRLRTGDKTELQTLFRSSEPITHLKALDGGRAIIASAGQKLIIGNTAEPSPVALKKLSYTWREFECSEWITSLDAWVDQEPPISNPITPRVTYPPPKIARSISVAAGGLKGSIFVYQDLLRKLERMERASNLTLPATRRLHWHRNAVGAVKWSMDGMSSLALGSDICLYSR